MCELCLIEVPFISLENYINQQTESGKNQNSEAQAMGKAIPTVGIGSAPAVMSNYILTANIKCKFTKSSNTSHIIIKKIYVQ